jgi:hypothetical protein
MTVPMATPMPTWREVYDLAESRNWLRLVFCCRAGEI